MAIVLMACVLCGIAIAVSRHFEERPAEKFPDSWTDDMDDRERRIWENVWDQG